MPYRWILSWLWDLHYDNHDRDQYKNVSWWWRIYDELLKDDGSNVNLESECSDKSEVVVKCFVMNQIDTMDDKDNVTSVTCSMGQGQRLHLCDPVVHLVTNQVYILRQHILGILWNVLRLSLHQKLPNYWVKKQTHKQTNKQLSLKL